MSDLSDDGFLDGRLRIAQPRRGFRSGADAVMLAAACAAAPGQSVLELGCGAGVASLCLGWRVPGLRLVGLEAQADYAELARGNAAANGIPMQVVTGNVAFPPARLRGMAFDHVIANPPYFLDGTPAPDGGRDMARREDTPLAAWIDAGLRRLRPGGSTSTPPVGKSGPGISSNSFSSAPTGWTRSWPRWGGVPDRSRSCLWRHGPGARPGG